VTTRPHRTLVLGGARSGKSRYAEALLAEEPTVTYVATGGSRGGDAEWADRIRLHRERRPDSWQTEEDADVATLLESSTDPVLVDCASLWVTGVLDSCGCWDDATPPSAALEKAALEYDRLVGAFAARTARTVIVSSEVGWGVVPATASGRLFRDELGRLNAALAAVAEEVVLVVAGLPLTLKSCS